MSTETIGRGAGAISRREFCRAAALGLGGAAVGYLGVRRAAAEEPGPLLPPIVTGRSVEICMNSRVSRHSGLGGTATDQQIANVLWAAGRAPVVGSYRTIYLKTPKATYIYHPEDHSLEYYSAGTVTNAFRIDYDRELDFDAGVADVLALWASVALWTGTAGQLASCPQMADLNFGINSVPGLTSKLVALSSDGSLPDPVTDGPCKLEEMLGRVKLRDSFRPDVPITPQRLSQILWAGYGCADHITSSGRAGLTVPSWVAQYFLTNRIYVVNDRVWRYCNRKGADLTTRDHRLELVQDADVRAAVQAALPGLPAAPCYVLLCLSQSGLGTWYQRLETGFVAGGLLLEGAAVGLGCAFRVPLALAEQQALQTITHTPAADYAHAVVAVGHPAGDVNCDGQVDAFDVDPFVLALTDPAGYQAQYPDCDAKLADINGDGKVDAFDIDPFVKLLIGG